MRVQSCRLRVNFSQSCAFDRQRHDDCCRGVFAVSRVGYTFASMAKAAGEGARFQFASDQALLVYFDQAKKEGRAPDKVGTGGTNSAGPLQSQITIQANENVRRLLRLLQLEPVAGVRNLHPAYCSLLVKFDAVRLRHEEMEAILRKYLDRLEEVNLPEPRLVEIPVCYGGGFGPGLAGVCAVHRMKPARAIEPHTSVQYVV